MKELLDNYRRYRRNPWDFLVECVYTLDQVDKEEPIKRFPNKEYLKFFAKTWQKYPLVAVPKSRRMTMSWATIGLYVWDTIFNRGRFNAFVSKKEDDAHELVMRAKFIVDQIREKKSIPDELIPKYKDKFCRLEFPDLNSKIWGFPQGADQLRQFTFSGIFGDESAFWEQAEEFYAASFPTIDGGGRMTLVSSPAPGFFKKLVFDAMMKLGDVNTAEYAPSASRPAEGIRIWINEKNRFLVFELHYTADPGKRHEGYKESIKNSMPLQKYLREYELYWDTFEGAPVFPEFQHLHVLEKEPMPHAGIPMLIGFDFGLTPAAVVCQLQGETLVVFKEYVEINMGAQRFVPKVIQDLRLRFPTFSDLRRNWKCFIDPSGDFRKDTDESTCSGILAEAGFSPIPGPVSWEKRRQGVTKFLLKLTPDGPAFQIYKKDCPVLTQGFQGGYRFQDKAIDIEPNKLRPLKDGFSHPHDALQYVCCGIDNLVTKIRGEIPVPRYFSEGEKTWPRKNKALFRQY